MMFFAGAVPRDLPYTLSLGGETPMRMVALLLATILVATALAQQEPLGDVSRRERERKAAQPPTAPPRTLTLEGSEPDASSQAILDFVAAERARTGNEQQAFWRVFELSLRETLCKQKSGSYVPLEQMQACPSLGGTSPQRPGPRPASAAIPDYHVTVTASGEQVEVKAQPRRRGLRGFAFDGSRISYTSDKAPGSTVGDPRQIFSALARYSGTLSAMPRKVITFESYPNGRPACANSCPASREFASAGVVFSGKSYLEDTGKYDMPSAPPNHAISKSSGAMEAAFPDHPVAVQFEVTQNNSLCRVPLAALDADNSPADVFLNSSVTFKSKSAVEFRLDTVVVASPRGIAGFSLSDDKCGVFIDNMVLKSWGDVVGR